MECGKKKNILKKNLPRVKNFAKIGLNAQNQLRKTNPEWAEKIIKYIERQLNMLKSGLMIILKMV